MLLQSPPSCRCLPCCALPFVSLCDFCQSSHVLVTIAQDNVSGACIYFCSKIPSFTACHTLVLLIHTLLGRIKNTSRISTKSIIMFFFLGDPRLTPASNSDSALKLRGRDEHTSYSSSQARIRPDAFRSVATTAISGRSGTCTSP